MKAITALSRLSSRAIDLLFPPRCLNCGAFGSYICDACRQAMPRALPPRCQICWMPERQTGSCPRCRLQKPAFEAARAAFIHTGAAREAVHALKYQGLSAIVPLMAELMADFLENHPLEADLLVAVPLHRRRQRQRGYNQAALLARELSRRLDMTTAPGAVRRLRSAPPQARLSDHDSRLANVAGAFAADPAQVQGMRILLIDDVMTSGATLNACASALREAGAASVSALTFSRED